MVGVTTESSSQNHASTAEMTANTITALKNPNTLARPTVPMNDMMLEALAIEVAFLAIFNA